MLNWSDAPGCYERHLQRKAYFPFLFADTPKMLSQKDVDDARQRDLNDLAELRAQVSDFVNELDKPLKLGDIRSLLDKFSELRKRAAEIGGEAPVVSQQLRTGREMLLSQMKDTLTKAGEQITDETLATFSALDEVALHPTLAQLARKDSPIDPDEHVPSLLTESPQTIDEMMTLLKMFKGDRQYRNHAIKLAKNALAKRNIIPDLKQKLAAFGVPWPHIVFILATARMKSHFQSGRK